MSQHSSNHNSKKKSAKAPRVDHHHDNESAESMVPQDELEATETVQASADESNESESISDSTFTEDPAVQSQVKIEFPYSDLVRSKIPKAFEVAEKVATEWKNEGEFKEIGLPHPLADALAAEALKKAKQVEKKLDEKGVFTIAKMGFEVAKSQINQLRKKG